MTKAKPKFADPLPVKVIRNNALAARFAERDEAVRYVSAVFQAKAIRPGESLRLLDGDDDLSGLVTQATRPRSS